MEYYSTLVVTVVLFSVSAHPDGPNIISMKDWSLPRLDPVKVGYERDVKVFEHPGERSTKATIKTVSVKPPVFEISDFLTEAECEHIIMYAKRLGFERSPLVKEREEIDDETSKRTFKKWDIDGDGLISIDEIRRLPGKKDIYVTNDDIIKMFNELDLDTDKNGKIDFQEFNKTTIPVMKKYFDKLREIPRMRSRNSEQAWLFHDHPKYPLLADFHGRLSRVTGLKKHLIRNSEPLQVVKYGVNGHYHAHHDSDELNSTLRCCTINKLENCRLCRFMTVLFFLNEPEVGGETAFPFADNKTFSQNGLIAQGNKFNLAQHCHSSNLVIKPKKGTAVMWYNHFREPRTGWLGQLDKWTLHGGCDVIKGVKWIANMWMNIIGEPSSEESFKGWLHAYEPPKTTEDKAEYGKKNDEDDRKDKEEL